MIVYISFLTVLKSLIPKPHVPKNDDCSIHYILCVDNVFVFILFFCDQLTITHPPKDVKKITTVCIFNVVIYLWVYAYSRGLDTHRSPVHTGP